MSSGTGFSGHTSPLWVKGQLLLSPLPFMLAAGNCRAFGSRAAGFLSSCVSTCTQQPAWTQPGTQLLLSNLRLQGCEAPQGALGSRWGMWHAYSTSSSSGEQPQEQCSSAPQSSGQQHANTVGREENKVSNKGREENTELATAAAESQATQGPSASSFSASGDAWSEVVHEATGSALTMLS